MRIRLTASALVAWGFVPPRIQWRRLSALWDAELTLGPDHADPNRLALFFWILQPRFLCAFLRLEGLGQRRKLAADVFEEEPAFNDSGHEEFMARAGRSSGLTVPSQRSLDLLPRTSERRSR